jgi:hypothetical protein
MSDGEDQGKPPDCDDNNLERAEEALRAANTELKEAVADLQQAERDIEAAERDLEEERRHRHHEVVVSVDRTPHTVPAGRYEVAKFKILVGVPADRELDILCDGALKPLHDKEHIEICGGEVFVSHARTGCSA